MQSDVHEPHPVVPYSEIPHPSRDRRAPIVRLALLVLIVVGAVVAWYVVFKTPFGEKLRDRQLVNAWVNDHRMIAPGILFGAYVICAVLMLPVWWLQALGGYCLGLFWGIVWCELGAMVGATLSLILSRWLVGQWFRQRYESRMMKLHAVNEKLGHNGLLVVMAVRLCHVLPFGVSNYLFGLTRITVQDVAVGTFLGGLPAVAFAVALGYDWRLYHDWRLWVTLAAVNVALLLPLGLRYWKPQWFKRIGVE
jgi:uncharacterized membrane protein YdjX (TVP38/TMEM64 family)